jgi:hypothetical protein
VTVKATPKDIESSHTSATWWAAIKCDPARIQTWLYDQYRDEVTAAERIETRCGRFTEPGSHDYVVLTGAHAERMRLERVETIANDPDAPADVRIAFARILPQEQFHAHAFAELATPEALARTTGSHGLGRSALGLSA